MANHSVLAGAVSVLVDVTHAAGRLGSPAGANFLPDATGYVVFGELVLGIGEDPVGLINLN